MVRSRFTPPERSFSKPAPLRMPSNPLNYRAFDIRTKMAVVRLCQRKSPKRGAKWSESGLEAATRGSDKWPENPAFRGIPTANQSRKKNVPNGETGGKDVRHTTVRSRPRWFQNG
jgi:hypothetical protein